MIFELALGGKIRDEKRKQRGVCLGPIGLIVAPWKSNVFKTRTSHFCGATISLWFLDRNIHFRTLLCIKLQALDERNCEVEFSTSERGHFGTRCHKLFQQFRVWKAEKPWISFCESSRKNYHPFVFKRTAKNSKESEISLFRKWSAATNKTNKNATISLSLR